MTEDSLAKAMRTLNESAALSEKFDKLFQPLPALDAPFAPQREADRQNRILESLRWACEAEERHKAELVADALARKLQQQADPPEPPPKPKKSREHELHEVIRRAHSVHKLTPKPLLKVLKNPEQRELFDPEKVIVSVADNGIRFHNWREEKTDFMERTNFNNFVSKLNTGKR